MHFYRLDAKTTESCISLDFSELWAEYVLFSELASLGGEVLQPP